MKDIDYTRTPDPVVVRNLRKSVGHSQTQAAQLVRSKLRTWQDWERDIAKMPVQTFALYALLTGHVTSAELERQFLLKAEHEQVAEQRPDPAPAS